MLKFYPLTWCRLNQRVDFEEKAGIKKHEFH